MVRAALLVLLITSRAGSSGDGGGAIGGGGGSEPSKTTRPSMGCMYSALKSWNTSALSSHESAVISSDTRFEMLSRSVKRSEATLPTVVRFVATRLSCISAESSVSSVNGVVMLLVSSSGDTSNARCQRSMGVWLP